MSAPDLPDDRLWTVDDVARFTRASKSWVYQQAAAGQIPCLKVCGLLRFDAAAVKQFFLSGGVEPQRKVIPLNSKQKPRARGGTEVL